MRRNPDKPATHLRSPRRATRRRGFTLVELLVVMAVIGMLVGLLLPAVQQAREAARRTSCRNNLRQLSLALQSYHDQIRVFPFGWNTHGTAWSAMLLPQLEQGALYDTLVFSETASWANGPNEVAAGTVLPMFRCPSMVQPEHEDDSNIRGRVPASYRGCGSSEVLSDIPSTTPAGSTTSQKLVRRPSRSRCARNQARNITSPTFANSEG